MSKERISQFIKEYAKLCIKYRCVVENEYEPVRVWFEKDGDIEEYVDKYIRDLSGYWL